MGDYCTFFSRFKGARGEKTPNISHHRQEAQRAGTALAIANMAIQQGDFENTLETLRHDDLNLNERLQNEPVNKRKYQEELFELMEKKKRDNSPWLIHT